MLSKCFLAQYSGTPLMRTPLGPTQIVLIREGSLFQGLFNIRQILSGPPCSVYITVNVLISGVSARRGSIVLQITVDPRLSESLWPTATKNSFG